MKAQQRDLEETLMPVTALRTLGDEALVAWKALLLRAVIVGATAAAVWASGPADTRRPVRSALLVVVTAYCPCQ